MEVIAIMLIGIAIEVAIVFWQAVFLTVYYALWVLAWIVKRALWRRRIKRL